MADALELRLPRLEPLVGAGTATARDVAHVHDEGEVLAVQRVDEVVERAHLGRAVGRIAHQRERKVALAGVGQRRGAAGDENGEQDEEPSCGGQGGHSRFSL